MAFYIETDNQNDVVSEGRVTIINFLVKGVIKTHSNFGEEIVVPSGGLFKVVTGSTPAWLPCLTWRLGNGRSSLPVEPRNDRRSGGILS